MAKPSGGGRAGPRSDPNQRLTKAERNRLARQERVELQRKMAKRRRTRKIGLIGGIAVSAAVALVLVLLSNGGGTPTAGGSGSPSVTVQLPEAAKLPGILRTSPPWPDNTAQLPQRLAALHLPQSSDMVLHHHTDLLIYVNGQPVTVPAEVGLITGFVGELRMAEHLDGRDELVEVDVEDPAHPHSLTFPIAVAEQALLALNHLLTGSWDGLPYGGSITDR